MKRIAYRLFLLISAVILLVACTSYAMAAETIPKKVLSAADSVVRIFAEYPDSTTRGSGFVIKSDSASTLIATNYHVVEDDPYEISVWVGSDETVSAKIIAYSEQKDLCVLALVYPVDMPVLTIGDRPAEQGDAIYAIGFPAAADELSDSEAHAGGEATITNGIVSAIREATMSDYGAPVTLLQINAAVNEGNSGGPLLNSDGAAVGVNTLSAYDSQGIYGAIEIGELGSLLAESGITLPSAGAAPFILHVIDALGAAAILFAAITAVGALRRRPRQKAYAKKAVPLAVFLNLGGKLSPTEAITLLMSAAEGLSYLHSEGKAHLAVSPGSVFCKNGRAYFQQKRGGAEVFANGFTPPELYKGMDFGAKSDIYSFCAVLLYAVTGETPENAIVRAENPAHSLLPREKAPAYAAESAPAGAPVFDGGGYAYALNPQLRHIIEIGMSVSPEDRFSSMRELIERLAAFAAQAEDERAQAEAGYNTAGTVAGLAEADRVPAGTAARDARDMRPEAVSLKRGGGHAVAVAAGVFLLIAGLLAGGYYFSYTGAINAAEGGDFAAAEKCLKTAPLVFRHDPELVSYIDAGLLLEGRQYGEAEAAFTALGDYMDAPDMVNETKYREAASLADANEFTTAISLYRFLSDCNYKDSAELVKATQFRYGAYAVFELGDFLKAYYIFHGLFANGYESAKSDEMLSVVTDAIYYEAVDFYYAGDYDQCLYEFELISPYERSEDYIVLSRAWRYPYHDFDFVWEADNFAQEYLVPLFDFEDTPDILLTEYFACDFLIGTWESSDGDYYFDMNKTADGYDNYCNLLSKTGTFDIDGGIYYLEDEPVLEFELLTPDSMTVYCYEDRELYTLFR
ncbi:MAG: trypsin-like peptidase domain-containing protein [Oscillospiraceae bacterium]